METLPFGLLETVSIQFPDPWFKKRHEKRKVLQPDLLIAISRALKPNSKLFIQSDLKSVINPMVKLINSSNYFYLDPKQDGTLLGGNPFSHPTEREAYVLEKGLEVYRCLFIRNERQVFSKNDFD